MSVYKQTYKGYRGPLTNARWRCGILTRYAFKTAFASKVVTTFYVLCFVPPVIAAGLIYIRYNTQAVSQFGLGGLDLVQVNGQFFNVLFRIQTVLTFMLATFIGPGLVSPDLTNNAISLYLSKPLSRSDYVLGKLGVLISLGSFITWIPGLILIGIQTDLAGRAWLFENGRIAVALFFGSWFWIVTVALLSLASSAWFKWKPMAAASMLGLFLVAAGFGKFIDEVLEPQRQWGLLLNMSSVIIMIFDWLFEGESQSGNLPAWTALLSLGALCIVSIWLLRVKIRACEVVR
jgi:ABC-2 type transport system permease protein